MIRMECKGDWLQWNVPPAWDNRTLAEVIEQELAFPLSFFQQLAKQGGILVQQKRRNIHTVLKAGDRVRFRIFEKEPYGLTPEPLPMEVLFEDEHLLVAAKPAGMAVHPTSPDMHGTLAHAIAYYYQTQGLMRRVRLVNRLDRDTTGACLVAKHHLAHVLLDQQLRERAIQRRYVAYVEGNVANDRGTIDLPIGRDRHHPTRRRVSRSPHAKPAITHYDVLARYRSLHGEVTKLRLQLETGRTHQIRVHLSHLGHPIVGDTLYGARRVPFPRQALHNERLAFAHPLTKEWIDIAVPYPSDLLQLEHSLQEADQTPPSNDRPKKAH